MHEIHKPLLSTTLLLFMCGFLIFVSASLGLLAKNTAPYTGIIGKQVVAAVVGMAGLILFSNISYTKLKRWAFPIFIFSYFLTALVFVPGVGIEIGGAKRWIDIGLISFQPAEALKFGFVLYFAAWLSGMRNHIHSATGLIPMAIVLISLVTLLLAQPNTGILVVILAAATAMLFSVGLRWRYFVLLGFCAVFGLILLATFRPYVKERVITYMRPESADHLDEGYQIRQSFIAIGSGGFLGKGFGQGAQKYNYLPEPMGDSIYAVLAEEFGFWGGAGLIIIFLLFALIGLRIARGAPDMFSRLLALGIVILIVSQSYWSIGAMLGVFPLSGVPIIFVSQGGSALMLALFEVGVLLNISKYIS